MRSRPLTGPVAAFGVRGRRTAELVTVPRRPGLAEVAAVNCARLGWRLLATACRHPVVSTVGLVVIVALHGRGVWPMLSGVAAAATGCGLWRLRWPESFEVCAARFARSGFRRFWVYRRFWQPAMVLSGLAGSFGGRPVRH